MTTEQKAKAYDEAIERASKLRVQNPFDTVSQMMEHVFPELKESEDEKIRKTLKHYLEVRRCQTQSDEEYINCNNFLAWLEKQGKHKKFRDSIQVNDEVTRNSDGVIVNLSQLKRVAKKSEQKLPIEKLPEEMKTIEESLGFTTQKECDEYNQMVSGLIMSDEEDYNNIDPHFGKLINKVESKFKAGNWYQCIKDFFGKGVIFDKNTAYYCAKEGCLQNEYGCHIAIVKGLYDNFKLWTIDDAKKGDILADKYGVYIYDQLDISDESACVSICGYQYSDKKFEPESMICNKSDFYPATKEQRDLLFQKMKEAGYEWDAEKKELKKVEKKSQRMISAEAKEAMYDKPTDEDMKEALRTEYEKGRADAFSLMQKEWSEEDEVKINRIVACLENLNVADNDILLKDVDWLKAIKDRYSWKPSDEQLDALEDAIRYGEEELIGILSLLYNDLKKLKGE